VGAYGDLLGHVTASPVAGLARSLLIVPQCHWAGVRRQLQGGVPEWIPGHLVVVTLFFFFCGYAVSWRLCPHSGSTVLSNGYGSGLGFEVGLHHQLILCCFIDLFFFFFLLFFLHCEKIFLLRTNFFSSFLLKRSQSAVRR
jgi:hypothetical protein